MLPIELRGDPEDASARARMLLDSVGLSERYAHYPAQLSGGEQQRVALARAFAGSPSLLFADEPTGNLDSVTGRLVMDLLLKLNRREGATLILVTHDPALSRLADRVVQLRDGRIAGEVRASKQASAAVPEIPR